MNAIVTYMLHIHL